jgi:hypothetical protein
MGPIGSGLPQLGFPRLLAMNYASVHGFKLLTTLDSDGFAKDSNPCANSQINRQKETAGAELAEDEAYRNSMILLHFCGKSMTNGEPAVSD